MSDSSYNVFLIDDDKDDRESFKDALKEIPAKRQFVTFNNGIELMAHLKDYNHHLPPMIFLDMNMTMSGEAWLRKNRWNPLFHDLPIVIYATSVVRQLANRAKALSAILLAQKTSSFFFQKMVLEEALLFFSKRIPKLSRILILFKKRTHDFR